MDFQTRTFNYGSNLTSCKVNAEDQRAGQTDSQQGRQKDRWKDSMTVSQMEINSNLLIKQVNPN